jgi:hypothetical protein
MRIQINIVVIILGVIVFIRLKELFANFNEISELLEQAALNSVR